MGIKVHGVESLLMRLHQTGERAVKGVSDEIRKGAYEIRDLAREYAPEREGNLEAALSIEVNTADINGRLQAFVYVDETHPARRSRTGNVGGYAMRMHESFYNLGPKSRAKDAGRGIVGRKYLERAAAELGPEIMERVTTRVRNILK
jgi:hypothetical protein